MFGVIGLGQMGGSIARKLLAENQNPLVFDVSSAAMETTGAKLRAQSPAEMAARCDIIAVVVLDDAQVRDVIAGETGILAGVAPVKAASAQAVRQPIVLVHSTIQPETVCDLAEQCAQVGLELLDAPVTGGPAAVENGDLVVMLGGPQETCDRVASRLSDYVGLAVRVGDCGAGQRAKIARNLITYSEWVVAAEATALASAADVDVEQLWKVIDHSDRHIGTHGGFGGLRNILPAPEAMRPLAGLARKDLGLAADLARQVDCDPWLADKAASLMSAVLLGE